MILRYCLCSTTAERDEVVVLHIFYVFICTFNIARKSKEILTACGDASQRVLRSFLYTAAQAGCIAPRFLVLVFTDAAVSLLQSKEDTRGAEGRWEAWVRCGGWGWGGVGSGGVMGRLKSIGCLYILRTTGIISVHEGSVMQTRWPEHRLEVRCGSWEEVPRGTTDCC